MVAWYLVIALCLVDGVLCHELMKAWDKEDRDGRNEKNGDAQPEGRRR